MAVRDWHEAIRNIGEEKLAKWDHDDLRDKSLEWETVKTVHTTKGTSPTYTTPPRRIHDVKSWAHFYDAIAAGKKLHDLRKNDRDYQVGDLLNLRRYDNINGRYTGESTTVEITYMTSNRVPCAFSSAVLPNDYCILSIRKV